MKKINFTLIFVLLFVTLITLPACNAVVTPVEVEKVKDVFFIKVRGDHHTQLFLFHYVNLSPEQQDVRINWSVDGMIWNKGTPILIDPDCSYDFSMGPYDYGTILYFRLIVDLTSRLVESVVIPPKP